MSNPMQKIRIGKVTLNIGAGKDQKVLEKATKLIKNITGSDPVTTKTEKRIAGWGLRPGLPIGSKLTMRGPKAEELLVRLIEAKDNFIPKNHFDENGNVAFGIHEYIDIPGVEYDPSIGVTGLQVCITLERPGYRVKRRRIRNAKIGGTHKVNQEDAIAFMKEKFKIKTEEEDEL
jgi:large subunit ribosomal protein L5